MPLPGSDPARKTRDSHACSYCSSLYEILLAKTLRMSEEPFRCPRVLRAARFSTVEGPWEGLYVKNPLFTKCCMIVKMKTPVESPLSDRSDNTGPSGSLSCYQKHDGGVLGGLLHAYHYIEITHDIPHARLSPGQETPLKTGIKSLRQAPLSFLQILFLQPSYQNLGSQNQWRAVGSPVRKPQ
jgi:hypothetical protein